MQRQSSSVSTNDSNVVVIDTNAVEANDAAPTNTEQSSRAARTISNVSAASQTLVTPTTGRRSSPVALFPIPCLNCQETNDNFLSADPARHVVSCLKCNKETPSSMYTPKQFVDACLHTKQASKSGSNTFKQHTESMYISQLANLKNTENDTKILELREKEFEAHTEEARARRRMEESMQEKLGNLIEAQAKQQAQQAAQQLAFSERFAMMMEKIIPKKSAFEIYEENKKKIATMLSNGDIDNDEANVLLHNIKRDLLNNNSN